MAASGEVIFSSRYRFSGSEIALCYHADALTTPMNSYGLHMYRGFAYHVSRFLWESALLSVPTSCEW